MANGLTKAIEGAARVVGALVLVVPGSVGAQELLKTYPNVYSPPFGLYWEPVEWMEDINGDGVGEIVTGDQFYSGQYAGQGRVLVLSGGTGQVLFAPTGDAPANWMGWEVAGLGDTNGDGVSDFAGISFGAPLSVKIWSGKDGSLLFRHSYGGWDVTRVGDLDGDGLAETLLGTGVSATVLRGGTYEVLYSLTEPYPDISNFGRGVKVLGDIDGDDVPDFAVGAPGDPPFGCDAGYTSLHSGIDGTFLREFFSHDTLDEFGMTLAGVGDVTGDGRADVAIGAPGCCSPLVPCVGGQSGAVRAFDGMSGSLLWTKTGVYPDRTYAFRMHEAGDVDGDGRPDLVSYFQNAVAVSDGYLVLDAGNGDEVMRVYNPSPTTTAYVGFARGLGSTGDFNGDDFPDVLVADWKAVHIFSGAPFGIESFGKACPMASGTKPRIGARNSPKLGTSFRVHLSQVPASALGLLLVGGSKATWQASPLPLDLAFIGMSGCSLLVSVDAVFARLTTPVPLGVGAASVEFAVPSVPALAGAIAYAQWLVLDPATRPIPAAATRALAITVQS